MQKKRGLGRGLEVLLADTSNLGNQSLNLDAINAEASVLLQQLQQEHARLLQEAEELQLLLADVERFLSSNAHLSQLYSD